MQSDAIGTTGSTLDTFKTAGENQIVDSSADPVTVNHTKARDLITSLDDAIKQVSDQRGELGAKQNRLEHTINNLGTTAENLTAAESRIRRG